MSKSTVKRRKFNLRELIAVPFTKVETRDGRFAKVNYIIPGEDFPLKGVMANYDGRVFDATWSADGKFNGVYSSPDDLVIVDEEPKYLQPCRA